MRRACIDIGSNTTRLLVADCEDGTLLEIHQERAFTRIVRALLEDGTIPSEKLAEMARIVAQQRAAALELGAVEIRCIATASIRRAANGRELADHLHRECPGLELEILSGEEEARLAFLGAATTLESVPPGPLGVLDVGGGSSEVVVGRAPAQIDWWASLPLGSGDIAHRCLRSDPPSSEEFECARAEVRAVLAGVDPPRASLAVAVGGSATSLRRLAGPLLDAAAFERSLGLLRGESAITLSRGFELDVERVQLLPAGLLILEALSGLLGAPLVIGRGGVREGALLDLSV